MNYQMAKDSQYLIFVLHERKYALPVSNLKEIIPYTKETKIPFPKMCQRGIIHSRDKTLPVFDISKLLNKQSKKMENGYFAILETPSNNIALYIDKPERIHNSMEGEIKKLPFKNRDCIGESSLRFDNEDIIILSTHGIIDKLSDKNENNSNKGDCYVQ